MYASAVRTQRALQAHAKRLQRVVTSNVCCCMQCTLYACCMRLKRFVHTVYVARTAQVLLYNIRTQ
jgi:hypothetical protein